MLQQHPITPSIELVKQWSDRWHSAKDNDFDVVLFVAIEAARWGADTELEACCEWTRDSDGYDASLALRADRRPPPELSPAAQAVFHAFNSKFDWVEDGVPGPQFNSIAAALRAAALYCKQDRIRLLAIADELEAQ